jgi:hypothetical protein
MSDRFGTNTWSLVVPGGWSARHDEECATLTGSEDVGTLQISAAFLDADVEDEDLRDLAEEHLEAGAVAHPAQAGDFVGFEIRFEADGSFWREWYLRCGEQALFVTYNCDAGSRDAEDEPIAAALASLTASGVPAIGLE